MSMAAASTRADAVYFQPLRYSAGFQKTPAERSDSSLVLRRDAFGHAGLGGAVGFADPAAGLAFGYAMNRHPSPGEPENARNQPLIDAAYRAVGYDHMWP
jgi:CubicO group peptidase (beta-lactamase class C family)